LGENYCNKIRESVTTYPKHLVIGRPPNGVLVLQEPTKNA